ncbi:hypothetical protein ACVDFE_07820 [Lentzea chajnantorensis]
MTAALTARQTGLVTIELRDDLGVPGVVDRDDKRIWLDSNQTDEDLLEVAAECLSRLLRPQLAAVEPNAPTVQESEQVVTPRPQLRLVRAGGDR